MSYNESVFATVGFDAAMCVVLSIDCEEMVGGDLRKIKTWAPWQPLGDLNVYRPLSALARMVEAMTALHGAEGVESRLCFFSCALQWEDMVTGHYACTLGDVHRGGICCQARQNRLGAVRHTCGEPHLGA